MAGLPDQREVQSFQDVKASGCFALDQGSASADGLFPSASVGGWNDGAYLRRENLLLPPPALAPASVVDSQNLGAGADNASTVRPLLKSWGQPGALALVELESANPCCSCPAASSGAECVSGAHHLGHGRSEEATEHKVPTCLAEGSCGSASEALAKQLRRTLVCSEFLLRDAAKLVQEMPWGGCSVHGLSTPSKIIGVSTPLRPCSRQRAKEMQDDVAAALEEESVPLLRVALQRRHACPGGHALHEAVRQAQVPAIRLLLRGRADPNARCCALERGCEFPLQLAVSSSNFLLAQHRLEVIEMLLLADANPNAFRSDAEANAPLHDAARRSDVEAVALLLRHRADPNLVNGFGEGPLELAVRPCGVELPPLAVTTEVLEALLHGGACPLPLTGAVGTTQREHTVVSVQCANPKLRALLRRWSGWWRCRMLAWIRSRGRGHMLCHLAPELLIVVARFL